MHSENVNDNPTRRGWRTKRRLLFLGFLSLGLVAASGWAYLAQHNANPIPKYIRQATTLTLYYPDKLPEGWALDTQSFSMSNGTVFYTIKGPKANIVISIQPRPPTFDYPAFYEQGMSGTTQFSTPIGNGAVGQAAGKTIGSLVAGSSWVLASPTSSDVKGEDITLVLSNLKKS